MAARSWAMPTRPLIPNCPLLDHEVAGKPGLFLHGRKLYFRYSSQRDRKLVLPVDLAFVQA